MLDLLTFTFDMSLPLNLLICTLASVVLGVAGAFAYMFRSTYTKGFVVTLAMLPVIVQMVIMLVNGEIGVGVAVMGAFGLVRFRSLQGSAREIAAIFLAMAMGLATGIGNIGAAALLLAVVTALNVILGLTRFGEQRSEYKRLKVNIPDNIDYSDFLDEIFDEYADQYELLTVKTVNLGSLYELSYSVKLKEGVNEKRFIDSIRSKNDNLTVTYGKMPLGNKNISL